MPPETPLSAVTSGDWLYMGTERAEGQSAKTLKLHIGNQSINQSINLAGLQLRRECCTRAMRARAYRLALRFAVWPAPGVERVVIMKNEQSGRSEVESRRHARPLQKKKIK